MRTLLIVIICKIAGAILRLLGKGSAFPGKIALKLDKSILKKLAKNYKVILVTGTNGKTTTTGLIYNILKTSGRNVITNDTGANMKSGMVALLIKNYKFFKHMGECFAVIEMDEAYARKITEDLSPEVFVVTNIFSDQTDRYGDVTITRDLIFEAIENSPSSTVILNGDNEVVSDMELACKKIYFGVAENTPDNVELNFKVEEIKEVLPNSSLAVINGEDVKINQGGLYNVYNAVCAFACGSELGVNLEDIKNGIENYEKKFGRQEIIDINGREVEMILVKNPVGFNEVINKIALDNSNIDLGFLLNDNTGDGTDISWIQDVEFEKFKDMEYTNFLIGGTRLYDLGVRLKEAGLEEERFVFCETYEDVLEAIKNTSTNKLYLLVTYSAMMGFRKTLYKNRYVKNRW